MKELRLLDLGPRVVAWHNRHPLARRIGVEHVHAMGYVVMPFVGPPPAAGHTPAGVGTAEPGTDGAPAGASLRERAMARARQAVQGTPLPPGAELPPPPPPAPQPNALKRAFSEKFLPPLSLWTLGRFGARQGVAPARLPHDAPVRQVLVDPAVDPTRVVERWVLTAQIDGGRRRTRVLVGAGAKPAILGRRLLSLPRVASLLVAVLAVALGTVQALTREPAEPSAVAVVLPASAAAWPARPASAPEPAPVLTIASTPALPPASAAVVVAQVVPREAPMPAASAAAVPAAPVAAASAPERPLDVEPTLGRIELPSLGPRIDARRRAAEEARLQAAADAAASAAAAAAKPPAPGAAPAQAPAARMAAAEPTRAAAPPTIRPQAMTGPAFAVSTRLLRTRTESEQVATAMRALLAPGDAPEVHVEVMPAGDDFRVVGWPYTNRASALQAQTLLATRGLKVQVIDF